MQKILLLFISCIVAIEGWSQSSAIAPEVLALDHLEKHSAGWYLKPGDIEELRVTDRYTSAHNGVTHVYFIQQYNGVDIDGATYAAHIRDGKVVYSTNHLLSNIDEKFTNGNISTSSENAVAKSLQHLGYSLKAPLTISPKRVAGQNIYEGGPHSVRDIRTELTYTRTSTGTYELTWSVDLEPYGDDMYDVRVSAATGEVVTAYNRTLYCQFEDNFLGHTGECEEHATPALGPLGPAVAADGPVYNVIPIPFESPIHRDRVLLEDPSDINASPYGWHDLDGQDGHDTTVTYGNNVFAMLDRDGDYEPDFPLTSGGVDMVFDFEFDQDLEPDGYADASVTNLFYMNNIMHDFSFAYGFDEFSGNFQEYNYTGAGAPGDGVRAHAQFGAGTANPPLNNATFGTPSDGGSGRMRMYVWEGSGANRLLKVEEPAAVAGTVETSTTSGWGAAITNVPVTAEVVVVRDGTGNPTQGCGTLINGAEVAGKIALIDRGNCEFGRKALNAQEAGAVGFIICNFQEGLVNMGAGAVGDQVTIPGVFIANSDCQRIRVYAGNGLTVSLVNETVGTGPSRRAGSFDNGVIAHEFGHGISNRLTGGPSRAGCLVNYPGTADTDDGEQMGEGWSDFFTLVTTVKATDTGERPRGIGTYAEGQDTAGGGIRPFPYTTDMTVNPMTYDDIAFYSVPHGVGSVWCTMLWDLYWALTDKYGFDSDLINGTGGNNLAVQLVMDGMKFQPCNPGFVDGRDAILTADSILTGAANSRLIWEVFARRGLGWSATQGVESTRFDGKEAFDVRPEAIQDVKITKSMTPYIEPGQDITVSLTVTNNKLSGVTEVHVSDQIPQGTSYINGSSNFGSSISNDEINFDPMDLESGESIELTYSISTATNLFSESLFFDDMENGDFNWDLLIEDGDQYWTLIDLVSHSGSYAWGVPNPDTTSDQSLILFKPVELNVDNPALMFYHQYNTEKFFDAGIVQVSADDGFTWNTLDESKVIRGDLTGKIQFALFAIPNVKAWHGSSNGWVASLIDLSDYAGETVQVRWRFGADGDVGGEAWYVDDVEIMDAFTYNSEACVSTAEGDQVCASAQRWGTLVATSEVSSTRDIITNTGLLRVFPNPANEYVNVELDGSLAGNVTMELMTNTGQLMYSRDADIAAGERLGIDVSGFATGLYFLAVTTAEGKIVEKLVID